MAPIVSIAVSVAFGIVVVLKSLSQRNNEKPQPSKPQWKWNSSNLCSDVGNFYHECKPAPVLYQRLLNISSEDEIARKGHWGGLKPLKYQVNMNFGNVERYDKWFERVNYTGSVTVLLEVVESTSRLLFHLSTNNVDLNFTKIHLRNHRTRKLLCFRQISIDNSTLTVNIDLYAYLLAREIYEFSVCNFTGTSQKTGQSGGIMVSDYISAPETWAVSTVFSMRHARNALPCWDHPSLKALFTVCLQHPFGTDSFASTRQISRTATGNSSIQTCFAETSLLPIYVFSFALTKNFHCIHSLKHRVPKIEVCFPKTQLNNFKWMINESHSVIDKMERLTGRKYMLDKLTFLNLDPVPFWGIENAGLVTMDSSFSRFPAESKQAHRILAHEIIHQWLGNLVTTSRWDDVCLQEGLTAFLEWTISYSADSDELEQLRAGKRVLALRQTLPIIRKYNATEEIAFNCFDKPPLVFEMIRDAFGERVLWKFLVELTRKFAYSNAAFDDWKGLLTSAAKDSRAGDMLEMYLKSGSHPLIIISVTDDTRITLTQTLLNGSEAVSFNTSMHRPFIIPLEFTTNSGERRKILLDKKSVSFDNGEKPKMFALVPKDAGLYRTAYTGDVYIRLAQCLGNDTLCKSAKGPEHLFVASNQVKRIFADFCWLMKLNVIPMDTDPTTAEVWTQLVGLLGNAFDSGAKVDEKCACCFKSAESIASGKPKLWQTDCMAEWNNRCSKNKLMHTIGRNQTLQRIPYR